MYLSWHIIQTGYILVWHNWGSSQFSEDDFNEELYWRGEVEPDTFTDSPSVIRPEHFQCLFMIMGFIMSLGLIVLLWDILTNPYYKFYSLMIAGLSACLLITFANLYFFSTALLTPITRESTVGTRTFDILTGEYEINMEMLVNNRMVAFAILGYGAVTSLIFIFIAMIRSLGKTHFLLTINNKHFIIDIIQGWVTTTLPRKSELRKRVNQ